MSKLSVAERFERAAADFYWVPPEVTVVERPEIVYVACPSRADSLYNSVAYIRAPSGGARALVNEVSAAHANVASRWTLTVSNPELEQALRDEGYHRKETLDLRAISVEAYHCDGYPDLMVERVSTRQQLLDNFVATDSAFEKPLRAYTEADLERALALHNAPNARSVRFVVYDRASREPISAGGLSLDRNLGVGFQWAGGTVAKHRGRGAYALVVEARVKCAQDAGLTHVGTFARRDTSSPILERRGYANHGEIVFWER